MKKIDFIIDLNNFTIICPGCKIVEKIPLKKVQKDWIKRMYTGDPHEKAKLELVNSKIEEIKKQHQNCLGD